MFDIKRDIHTHYTAEGCIVCGVNVAVLKQGQIVVYRGFYRTRKEARKARFGDGIPPRLDVMVSELLL